LSFVLRGLMVKKTIYVAKYQVCRIKKTETTEIRGIKTKSTRKAEVKLIVVNDKNKTIHFTTIQFFPVTASEIFVSFFHFSLNYTCTKSTNTLSRARELENYHSKILDRRGSPVFNFLSPKYSTSTWLLVLL
jgi:hypothetical protein